MIKPRHFPPVALTIFVCFFLPPATDQLVLSYQVMIKADSFPQIVYEQHCLQKEQVALKKRHQLPKSRLRKIGDG